MEIKFYSTGTIENEKFKYAVISASCRGMWIFARHRERRTWEIPGGHREENEAIEDTASRELYEETGAVSYDIEPVCDYSVSNEGLTAYGRLFYARVDETGPLPESEIAEVMLLKDMADNLTYPEIQPVLQKKVLEFLMERVFALLEKDTVRNINMINFMRYYPVFSIDMEGNSVLIRGRSDENWVYISSENNNEFAQLIKGLDDEDRCFAILEDWMLPAIVRDRKVVSQLTSIKLVYESSEALPENQENIVKLSSEDASYIFENSKYKEYLTIEYIEDRIANGIGLGIRVDGKLAAWAITHDDGAIGFLNVLEEYRRRGYGREILSAMVNRLILKNEVPFVHIEEDNLKSMNLALKTGFKKDRRIHWTKLDTQY